MFLKATFEVTFYVNNISKGGNFLLQKFCKKNRLYLVSKKCDSAHKCFKFKFQLWIIILSLLEKFKFMNLNSNFKENNFFFILQMQENQNKSMFVQYFTLPDILGMSWNSLSLAKSNLSWTYPFDDNKDMPQMF